MVDSAGRFLGGRSSILLVEDSADDEELTVRALRASHVLNELAVARDGVEALEYLLGQERYADRRSADPPALVILDLHLPKLDGIGVLRRMRSEPRTALIPVVVLTSSIDDEDMLRSYSSGANSFVRKPVELAAFLAAVAELGVYWTLVNEPPPDPSRVRRDG